MQRKRLTRFIATATLAAGLIIPGLATDAFAGFLRDGGDPERTSFELAGQARQYGGTEN